MPAPYQNATLPFTNKGVVSAVDHSLLQPGEYRRLNNVVSLTEGTLTTRNGFQRVNSAPFVNSTGTTLSLIHTLGRLATGNDQTKNYRYLGAGQDIYRVTSTLNPTLDTPVTSLGASNFGHKWKQVAYRKDSSGYPYAYFATPSLMGKDVITDNPVGVLNSLSKWGIDRPTNVAKVALGAALTTATVNGNANAVLFKVTRTGGQPFDIGWAQGTQILVNGVTFAIDSVQDESHLTLQSSADYLYNTNWSVTYATTAGPNSTITNYSYVYTLRNPITGVESNPSMLMKTGITAFHQAVNVTVNPRTAAPQTPGNITATAYVDPQVSGANSIAIYRAGGAFDDGFYRFVGYTQPNTSLTLGSVNTNGTTVTWNAVQTFDTTWPQGTVITIGTVNYVIDSVTNATTLKIRTSAGVQNAVPYSVTINLATDVVFTDTSSDAAIAANKQVEFDNDPPVTSTLPLPFRATISSFGVGGGTPGNNIVNLTVNQGLPAGQTQIANVLRPGSILSIGTGATQEFVVLVAITGDTQIACWLQYTHLASEIVQTDSVANMPCTLCDIAFDSLFLGGDTNNPTLLYKSKTGRPESFPVVNLEDGSPGSIEVGTPSNPLVNFTEFNGDIVCLNKSSLFLVRVWRGAMQNPVLTPATRGLFGKNAFCKGDNQIWYLSYDGIYSWAGGQSVKISKQIDPLFRGENFNGYPPISLSTVPDAAGVSDLDRIQFEYYKNQLHVIFRDINTNNVRWRYDTVYDRWTPDNYSTSVVPTTHFLEQDTGTFLLATSEPSGMNTVSYVNIDDTSVSPSVPATSDGWTASTQDDGKTIAWEVWLPWFTGGAPSMQKQVGDAILELQNASDGDATHTVVVQTFYDFSSTADPTDTFVITQAPGRRRVPLPLKSGSAQEAYAVSFRLSGTTKVPVTLYTLTFNYLVLEQVQRGRALDWDNLGYNYDKKLTQLAIEFDTQGANVTLNLDTMAGIGAGTESQAVQTFTLASPLSTEAIGPVRARAHFPINDGTVVKMVRLRPTITSTNFKIWDYSFDKIEYPPDKTLFTEWSDQGYGCDKLFRELLIEIDTGNTDATVNFQADGVTRQTWTIRTTSTDRKRILTFNQGTALGPRSDVIGKIVRLTFVPDPTGKTQLFGHTFNWIPEPCSVLHFDSFEQAFSYNGFKFLKQMWVEYACDSSITVKTYRDFGQLLLSTTLPRHEYRNVERFPFPPISARGVFNKSKVYRWTIEPCNACAPFKLYRDSTRVEVMPLSGDQRQAYQQAHLWEPMPIPIQ